MNWGNILINIYIYKLFSCTHSARRRVFLAACILPTAQAKKNDLLIVLSRYRSRDWGIITTRQIGIGMKKEVWYQIRKESTTSSCSKRSKSLYRGYLHCIANFCATSFLNVFSKEIISNKIVENNFSVHIKHLKVLMRKFYMCFHNFLELWN